MYRPKMNRLLLTAFIVAIFCVGCQRQIEGPATPKTVPPDGAQDVSSFITDENVKMFIAKAEGLGQWAAEMTNKTTDGPKARQMSAETGWTADYMMRVSMSIAAALEDLKGGEEGKLAKLYNVAVGPEGLKVAKKNEKKLAVAHDVFMNNLSLGVRK